MTEALGVDDGWPRSGDRIRLPDRVEIDADPQRAVERFLVAEAALLDADALERWWELFAEDALYWLPMSRDASVPSAQLNLIFDDKRLLGDRIFRIRTGDAHTQDPPSQVTRVIGGVRVEGSDVSALPVWSTLLLTEFRRDTATHYTARCSYLLRATSIGFEIVRKRVDLSVGSAVLPGLTFLF